MINVKEESEKADLKVNIQKTKIMASVSSPLGKQKGRNVKAVTNFILLGSRITEDGDCSHETKRCLLLGRKTMTNLESIFKKQRHHFANRSPYS